MSPAAEPSAPSGTKMLIDEDSTFAVFIDKESLDVGYELRGAAELSQESRAFLSRARIMGVSPTTFLTADYRLVFKRTIGESMALAIRGDLPTAEQLLASADEFMADRAGETARMWYVQAIIVLLVLLFSPFVFLEKFELSESDQFYVARIYALAIIGGALGAGFSLLMRVGNLKIDPASGRFAHYGEVVFRLTIGALAALIIVIGLEANVFAGFMKVASEDGKITEELYYSSFWVLAIFSIAAGSSERLVPSLLEQFSKQKISESGAATGTQTESKTGT